jgi:hypothetical protein
MVMLETAANAWKIAANLALARKGGLEGEP